MFRKLKFARSFFAAVNDPDRTQEILTAISDPSAFNEETFRPIWLKISANRAAKALVAERFLGNWKLDDLLKLPPDSFGFRYARHMIDNQLDPNFYDFAPGDSDHIYLYNRGLQIHDILHVLTGFDTSIAGEAGLQGFVHAQINARSAGIIMPILALHCALYKPATLPLVFESIAKGCAMGLRARLLYAEKFEENWAKDFNEYREELRLLEV